MKKIISAFLITVMILSAVAVSTSAAGILLDANFANFNEEQFYSQFMPGAFHVDDVEGVLYGYSDAKALQSMYEEDDSGVFINSANTWLTYDAAITFAMADDDAVEWDRTVNIAYCNDNLRVKGLAESRDFFAFSYDVQKMQFDVSHGSHPGYNGDEFRLADPVARELDCEGNTYYTMGMSVEKNRIRFFFENELIYDLNLAEHCIAESVASPFIFWNDGNYMKIKNITVSSQGYLYPSTDNVGGGEGTDATEATEATTSKKVVDVTDDSGNAVTDEAGNKVTEEIIITNALAADTNTGGNAGGTSTTTGDSAFIVVAALVATIGCALIVRKVKAE